MLKHSLQFVIGVVVITIVGGLLAGFLVERAGQRLDAPRLDAPAAVSRR